MAGHATQPAQPVVNDTNYPLVDIIPNGIVLGSGKNLSGWDMRRLKASREVT
jgi:hypothetical protein